MPKCVNKGLIILPSKKQKSGAYAVWLVPGGDALAVVATDVTKHGAIQRMHGTNLMLRFTASIVNKLDIEISLAPINIPV